MRAGFAVWNERIAPVFDTARHLLVVEAEAGRIVHRTRTTVPSDSPAARAVRLAELAVEELVCGAISFPLRTMVAAYGIRVVPFVTGTLVEVVEAWRTGTLGAAVYAMPGCGGRGRHGRGPRGGRFVAGPGGVCVCPRCGHRRLHERGVPCNQSQCPNCGLPMTRA